MNKFTRLWRLGLSVCAMAALPWLNVSPPRLQTSDLRIQVTQMDSSQFPKIKLYISVTNAAGEPVAVDASRLQLTENGKPVTPEFVSGSGEIGPLTTLLIMDVSGSMNQAGKLAAAKAAAQAYVDQMRPGDQGGLVTFNTEVNYVQPLTTDHAALSSAIAGLTAHNDTAMYDAVAQGITLLANAQGRKAIIVLTDGIDNRSHINADRVVEQIGSGGLSISTIGLGDPSQLGVSNKGLDESALKSLAERAGGVYGFASDPEALRALYQRYGSALQSEYVLTYATSATLRDGVNRNLSVSLADAGASTEARYNPGGVMPEVAQRASWPVFGLVLVALVALLVAPVLLTRGLAAANGLPQLRDSLLKRFAPKKTSRIRLHDQSQTTAQPRIRLR